MQFQKAKAKVILENEVKTVYLSSIQDILNVFAPHQQNVTQVDIDRHHKVYYSLGFLDNTGVKATVTDAYENRHFLVYPILVVECNDYTPIPITETGYQFIKKKLNF